MKLILLIAVFSMSAIFATENSQIILSIKSDNQLSKDQIQKDYPTLKKILFSLKKNGGFETLIVLDNLKNKSKSFLTNKNINWVEDDVVVNNPMEYVGTIKNLDPRLNEQHHHKVMKNLEAWNTSRGSNEIIVAIADSGVDPTHEDLSSNLWVNKDEIPNNNIDDDNNGYVDDVNGWNFCLQKPTIKVDHSHGTHVGGIVAAANDNGVGVSGTAPNVKMMNIQWYASSNCSWTLSLVVEAYAYIVDNGARLVNTSYNIDGFATKESFISALEYGKQKGVIYFNSGGNSNRDNAPRLVLDQIMMTVSTNSENAKADLKSSYSNYGLGMDISSPGENILSTLPGSKYGSMSGTSMASPNAVAVAALIWSQNPEWTREQVAAQLKGTCDEIDAKNESRYKNKLGAGRVNSLRALTEKAAPPKFLGIKEIQSDGAFENRGVLTLISHSVFDADQVLDVTNYQLEYLGRTGTDKAEIVDLSFITQTYDIGTNLIKFKTPNLMVGKYRFTAKANNLVDPFGSQLDGNIDGIAGDDYVQRFVVSFK